MKTSITISGASDDLIEIGGDIKEEFSALADDEDGYLFFSDGWILKIAYTDDGTWRITTIKKGAAKFSKVEAEGSDSDNYSDKVTLDGEITWVGCGSQWTALQK